MKNFKSIFIMLTFIAITFISCSDSTTTTNTTGTSIPDAVFSATITGAESQNLSFTLPKGTAGEFAVNGSVVASIETFQILARQFPTGWSLSLVAKASAMATGTYKMNEGAAISSFVSQNQTSYLSTSGEIVVTKAELYQAVSQKDWYISGTFNMVCQNPQSPGQSINVSGSFSGINIKEQ